jgi:hypothetical protein
VEDTVSDDQMFEVPGDRLRELTADAEAQAKRIHYLGEQLQSANVAIMQLVDQKDNAYTERNYLVAVISKIWPSHMMMHQPEDDPDWDEKWRTVICVHVAGRRCGWHIHDSERHLFVHLDDSPVAVHGYDGMTTVEKYGVLSSLPVTWPHG